MDHGSIAPQASLLVCSPSHMADLLFPFVALTIIVTTQYLNVAKWRKDNWSYEIRKHTLNMGLHRTFRKSLGMGKQPTPLSPSIVTLIYSLDFIAGYTALSQFTHWISHL